MSSEQKGGKERERDTDAGEARQVPNPVQVQKFLGGLDYPVDKSEIVEKARSEGADENVMQALESIPDREYESPVSVSREIGNLD